jgi:signal transduction histidine kinase
MVLFLYSRVWPFPPIFTFPNFNVEIASDIYGGIPLVFLFGAISSLTLFTLTLHLGARRKATRKIHRIDYYTTAIITLLALSLVAILLIHFRYYWFAHVTLVPITCLCALYLWATTAVRFSAGTFLSTMFWVRAFRVMPRKGFFKNFVAVVTGGATLFFTWGGIWFIVYATTNVFSVDSEPIWWAERFFFSLCLPALIIVLIRILCGDIIRLSDEKDREAESRLNAERFRAELITNVTHDLRTPLTSIINYVDLIGKLDIDHAELREYVDVLNRKSDRLKKLIGDIMDASKASTGNLPVRFEVIDLAELTGQVAGDYDDAFSASDLTYINNNPEGKVMIRTDGALLYRVLENLFSNISKYAMTGTRVYVDIETFGGHGHGDKHKNRHGYATLRLRNISREPLNITPDELTRQFVRGETSRTTDGNGLGLYIANCLTTLMEGQFKIGISGDLFETTLVFPLGEADAAGQDENPSLRA